ncbi:GNAT family N-acetyltransferase [Roseibacterium sp. SDUM158016]|nr:GNAT family N-acetyltransferase [Roseibacterium sp. SDUM158016]
MRPWAGELGDAERRAALKLWLADILTPAVLAPLPAALAETADMDAWLEARSSGGEVAVVSLRDEDEDQDRIGLFFLKALDEGAASVGYLFAERAWGRGYASEALGGTIRALAPRSGLRLHAAVVPENAASARVLEKNGFRRDPDADADGVLWFQRMV